MARARSLRTAAVAPPADRLEFETLISDVSAALMAISPEQVEPAIDHALDKLRNFFSADHCAVLTVSDDLQVVDVLQASYASGVSHVRQIAARKYVSTQRSADSVPVRISRGSYFPC